jgi:hypothetical protein
VAKRKENVKNVYKRKVRMEGNVTKRRERVKEKWLRERKV